MSSVGFADYPLVWHRYLADPDGLEYNGQLYVYCSNDDDNSTNGGYAMHSIVCISTDDLKNWTDHGVVLNVPDDASWASYSWAPSVIYRNGLFYMYFGNNAGGGIGVATNASPTGPFVDARGSALINSSTPGASGTNQWYFDPCVFMESNQAYLYFGGNNSNNARVALLNSDMVSLGLVTNWGTVPYFLEASDMHKHNGTCYFSYETGGSQGEWIKYGTNTSPTSGFTYLGNVLQAPNNGNNNHAAFITFQSAEYVVYQNRYLAALNGIPTTYKRNVCLDSAVYNADGTMPTVVCTSNGLAQLKYVNPYHRVEAETIAQDSGIDTGPCREGGMDVTNILNGNWIMLRGVDFTSAGATNFTARIASAGPGGNIELHLDSLAGTLIGTCPVPATGGWQTWANASCGVTYASAKGVHDLYLKFTGATPTNLFNFNSWQFQSATNSQSPASLVKFEAESGALGSNWAVSNSTAPAYITITTDDTGNIPSNSMRVATYTITFPTSGTYHLFGHVRVGAGAFNDDSLFYGNGFGIKNPTNSSDWILINGLANTGFTDATDNVTGGGTAGTNVWKWIDLSLVTPGVTFIVPGTNLTQTFQIGGRETGLDLDAFVFGLSGFTYTVSDLDNGTDGTPPAAGTCTITWTNVLQRIDGFGAGVVFLDSGLDPVAGTNMDTLFNTNNANQLGLTLLRVRIAPNNSWTNNVSAWSTSLSDAQQAVARGAGVLATPWTPPANMKTNSNTVGGSLATNQYANYANYLNTFAGYMKSNRAPLAAVSVQNEPDFLATYESCLWTATQFQTFFHNNAAAITNAPVMMPESFHFDPTLSDPTLNDPVAVTNVGLVGGHLYGGTIADYPNAHNRGLPTWMTEYLINDQTINTAIQSAQQIHDCLATGNMSAYLWWKCIGDINGLLSSHGIPQKRGFVLAQFSRFVRPGYHRIGATNLNGAVLVTAYRNTNSAALTIVAINPTSIALTPTFNLQDFPPIGALTPWMTSPDVSLAVQANVAVTNATFSYTLPGLSVVTFVGQTNSPPNSPPTLAAVANSTINAGVTLLVTNFAGDPDLPTQTLTFALLAAPTNAAFVTLNSTNALITWRPLVGQADSTNSFTVAVADNGSPGLSATNSFTVTVNPLSSLPSISSLVPYAGTSFNLTITGPSGPDYTVMTSTNLLDWQSLQTANSPSTPFILTVTNRNESARFYRIQLGP